VAAVRGWWPFLLRLVAAEVKLTASLILRNERSRYLDACLSSLLEFCEEVRVWDDGSTDGWDIVLPPHVIVRSRSEHTNEPAFHNHAWARNQLVDWTLQGDPTFVLAIDADEFVSDGQALRRALEHLPGDVFTLSIEEAWELCDDCICVREDGGWRSHEIGNVWRPEAFKGKALTITDRGHATGRVPDAINGVPSVATGVQLLHLGWANKTERAERFERYAVGDGGRFHAKAHIDSIMWEDRRVSCRSREWPAGLAPYKDALIARAAR